MKLVQFLAHIQRDEDSSSLLSLITKWYPHTPLTPELSETLFLALQLNCKRPVTLI